MLERELADRFAPSRRQNPWAHPLLSLFLLSMTVALHRCHLKGPHKGHGHKHGHAAAPTRWGAVALTSSMDGTEVAVVGAVHGSLIGEQAAGAQGQQQADWFGVHGAGDRGQLLLWPWVLLVVRDRVLCHFRTSGGDELASVALTEKQQSAPPS